VLGRAQAAIDTRRLITKGRQRPERELVELVVELVNRVPVVQAEGAASLEKLHRLHPDRVVFSHDLTEWTRQTIR
jgi:hypothetical protein